MDDILPPVNISLANTNVFTATVERGEIFQGSRLFTNVSEVIALEEGKEQDPADNLFFFEPGRLLYHSIEFCNLVHVCTVSMGTPSIVIRELIMKSVVGGRRVMFDQRAEGVSSLLSIATQQLSHNN